MVSVSTGGARIQDVQEEFQVAYYVGSVSPHQLDRGIQSLAADVTILACG
jgi:hypothetical protein